MIGGSCGMGDRRLRAKELGAPCTKTAFENCSIGF